MKNERNISKRLKAWDDNCNKIYKEANLKKRKEEVHVILKRSKKGQAAFEYLITYGWAFLVILTAIGVLSYFGMLNPQKYIPDSCEFGEQLKCIDYVISDDDTAPSTSGVVVLRMRNNFEQPIEITDVYDTDGYLALDTPITIEQGVIKRVEMTIDDTLVVSPGEKKRFRFNIEFRRDGGSNLHNISGMVFAEVADHTVIGTI